MLEGLKPEFIHVTLLTPSALYEGTELLIPVDELTYYDIANYERKFELKTGTFSSFHMDFKEEYGRKWFDKISEATAKGESVAIVKLYGGIAKRTPDRITYELLQVLQLDRLTSEVKLTHDKGYKLKIKAE